MTIQDERKDQNEEKTEVRAEIETLDAQHHVDQPSSVPSNGNSEKDIVKSDSKQDNVLNVVDKEGKTDDSNEKKGTEDSLSEDKTKSDSNSQKIEIIEEGKSQEPPRSYEERCYFKYNLLSILTFGWMTPLIWKGTTRLLGMSDLPELKESMKIETLYASYDKWWNRFKNRKGAIFLTLYFMNFWYINVAGFLNMSLQLCRLGVPLALRQILLIMQQQAAGTYANPLRDILLYLAALLVGMFGQTCFIAWHHGLMQRVGIKIRSVLTAVIYRKSLKLSNRARAEYTQGVITNNIAVDTMKLERLMEFVHFGWAGIIGIVGCLIGIGVLLRWAVVAGVIIAALTLPSMMLVMTVLAKFRKRSYVHSDKRLKYVSEILSGIKIIKYMVWENKYLKRIIDTRKRESIELVGAALSRATMNTLLNFSPSFLSLCCFITYFLIYSNGGTTNPFTVDVIFPSLAYFNALRVPLTFVGVVVGFAIDCAISLKRIEGLLRAEEVDQDNTINHQQDDNENPIAISIQGKFQWDEIKEVVVNVKKTETIEDPVERYLMSTTRTPLGVNLPLRNIDLEIERGSLVCIVGAVGSGKSSLISAMIGEMRQIEGPQVRINGKIAYCPQQAWVMNATLLDNITFGTSLDEEMYKVAVKSTDLYRDIQQFAGGRLIEIGEKGVNLSGGQKQRLSLARSVYRNADIVLMDDPLSAVDAHVGKHIFDNCIMGSLKKKTRIFVTHQLQYAKHADLVLVMQDSKIVEKGTYEELVSKRRGILSDLVKRHLSHEEDSVEDTEPSNNTDIKIEDASELDPEEKAILLENEVDPDMEKVVIDLHEMEEAPDVMVQEQVKENEMEGKLMAKEELQRGYVSLRVWFNYFKAMGGFFVIAPLAILLIVAQGLIFGQDFFLSQWATGAFNASLSPQASLGIYAAISVTAGIMTLVREYANYFFGSVAAYRLHKRAITRVIMAPMSWFDTTPIGRVMSRFSKDLSIVDLELIVTLTTFFSLFLQICFTLVLIIVVTNGTFLLPLIPVVIVYFVLQEVYRRSSREIKRLESVARSPLFAHVNETLTGLQTIRAYQVQNLFSQNNFKWIDHHNRAAYLQVFAARWLYFRIETLGSVIVSIAAVISIMISFYGTGSLFVDQGSLALAITYSLQITQFLSFSIRNITEAEIHMNSVERLVHYCDDIPIEEKRNPPTIESSWPKDGAIEFKNFEMKYRPHLPLVLNGVTMTIRSGEKIGVIGRTGAGKSSLMTAIYRLVEAHNGSIEISGKNISEIPLAILRRNLSIIPQEPVLFSGTVRSNLDPFNEHDDAKIWETLRRAYLKSAIENLPSGLDAPVSEGGENFSVGQRQLLCLARAILRSSKILILDEATASVDLENDALIQKTIREAFSDCTILTIAHRLNTIIDSDRILVMSEGKVHEFDTTLNLLSDTKSLFFDMICETGPTNAKKLLSDVLGTEKANNMLEEANKF